MTLANDRDAEMAAGSTWATSADEPGPRRGDTGADQTGDGTSTTPTDTTGTTPQTTASNGDPNGAADNTPPQGGNAPSDATPTDTTPTSTAPTDPHTGSPIEFPILTGEPGTDTGSSSPVLAGDNGVLQPVLNVANTAVTNGESGLGTLSDDGGLSTVVHGVTTLGDTIGLGHIGTVANADGHTNLLTDVLNAPGEVLNGNLSGAVSHLGADLSDILNSAGNLVNTALLGTGTLNSGDNPVSNLISDLGHDLQSLPLLNINGGNNSSNGGLLGGALGNLNSSSGGHLVAIDVGPEGNNGQAINLLSQPEAGPHHALEVNAIDVTPGSPHLADLGLLTGSNGLNIPSLGGTGADGLTGHALGGSFDGTVGGVLNGALSGSTGGLLTGPIASGNTANVPVAAPINIDAVHDLITAPLATAHGVLDTHGSHIL